jgi:carbon-monoxide dehydrogenase medium subunit
MASTTYDRATTIEDALATLAEHGFDAKVLAGGQSLIPMMSLGLARPARLVDIGRVADLDRIDLGEEIRLGALVRHAHLAHPPADVARAAPLLPAAAPYIGHEAIRTRGTFCGSIAHGDPAAEWPAVALALDAVVEARSARGERSVPAADFFVGPLTTVLDEDELVTGVRLPVAAPRTGAAVLELAFRHGDYAVVGVAAQVTLGEGDRPNGGHGPEGGAFEDVRIGLFGVGGTPIRARTAEAIARAGAAAFEEAGQAAAAESDPVSDATASADYRRRMTAVFVRRTLTLAAARAAGVESPVGTAFTA